eukprot:COSAG02_NODE_396_length_23126_cov_282.150258_25_plen_31_part_00
MEACFNNVVFALSQSRAVYLACCFTVVLCK